jgi:hypothetical protein
MADRSLSTTMGQEFRHPHSIKDRCMGVLLLWNLTVYYVTGAPCPPLSTHFHCTIVSWNFGLFEFSQVKYNTMHPKGMHDHTALMQKLL